MTTTPSSTIPSDTSSADPTDAARATSDPSTAIDRFLAGVCAGHVPADVYAADAVLDATVPNWRFTRRGAAAIAGEYAGWFADAGRFEQLERLAIASGEVVTYVLTWEQQGVPHAAHHSHRLIVDQDGRISADRVFCGGRWPADLLASMQQADDDQ